MRLPLAVARIGMQPSIVQFCVGGVHAVPSSCVDWGVMLEDDSRKYEREYFIEYSPRGIRYVYENIPQSLDSVVTGFIIAMGVTPFLQSLASHFGNKLAGVIDEATRAAVRRFIRREADLVTDGLGWSGKLRLYTERKWHVEIDSGTPVEALVQLFEIQQAELPDLANDPTPKFAWSQSKWRLVGSVQGVIVEHSWNAEFKRWDQE